MSDPAKPSASASVIFAAVVAILAGLLSLLSMSLGFLGILLGSMQTASPELPPFLKNITLVILFFLMCLSVFGVATGIGLILLRNWARISVLIWGGLSVFFGVIGVAVAFLIPLASSPGGPGLPGVSMLAVRFIILVIYGLPLIIGIWWLILFNRKGISSQFTRSSVPVLLDPSAPQKPRSPIPIVVLAWFLVSSAANIVLLPFLPFRFPAVFFGYEIPGTAGSLVFLLLCVVFVFAGVGLLKLKRWSYQLTICLQLFSLTSGTVTALSPNSYSLMNSAISKMNNAMRLPANIYNPIDYSHSLHFFMLIGLLFPVAILVLLFYYRERFLEAASAAGSSSGQSIPS